MINDVFKIRGNCVGSFQLFIFNRWGEKIFEATDISQYWDGTYKDELCAAGNYSYLLSIKLDGKDQIFKGIVTLIR